MLFKVEMKVNLPTDMPTEVAGEIKAREKPTPKAFRKKASGAICGVWRAATRMSAFSTLRTTPSYRT